jgi:hypothetical protein
VNASVRLKFSLLTATASGLTEKSENGHHGQHPAGDPEKVVNAQTKKPASE